MSLNYLGSPHIVLTMREINYSFHLYSLFWQNNEFVKSQWSKVDRHRPTALLVLRKNPYGTLNLS